MSIPHTADVLITGGSGFLGRNLVKALLKNYPSWRITILDLHPPPPDLTSQITKFLQVDITSPESVNNAFKDHHPDIVIHSAGIVPARHNRYSTNKKLWEKVKTINYNGTINILNTTLASGCKNFVYTSSCTVIIDDIEHDYYNSNEDTPLGYATLHYGKSKALAEQYVLSSEHSEKGLKACALRPCTIIGPGDTAVISVIHDLIAKGETNFIVGDGNNLYDWMYIDNAVQAHILAIENLLTTGTAAGLAINISNQEPVYLWDFFLYIWAQFGHVPSYRVYIPAALAWFVALVLEVMTWVTGKEATLDTGSVQDGIRVQYADNTRAQKILGYYPEVELAEGVRRSCEDYKKTLATKHLITKKKT